MNFKIFNICFVFTLFHFLGIGQNFEIDWEKRLVSKNFDLFSNLIENKDGGVTIIGAVYPEGKLDQDFWLVKYDAQGEEIWSKTYGTVFNEIPLDFAQFNEGDYILVGKSIDEENGCQSFFVKTDGNGNEIWQHKIEGSEKNTIQNVIAMDDRTFIVSGSKISENDIENIWLAKYNEEGEMLWEKTFGDSKISSAESMKKLPNGDIVIAARIIENGILDSDLWLFRFDGEGEKLWDKHLKSPEINIWPECVCCCPDKNIVVAGWYGTCMNDITSEDPIFDYDLFLAKISPEGKVIWTKNIDSEGSEGGNAIVVRPDGNILVAGKKETSFLGRVGKWILLTDQEGTMINELVIPFNFNNDQVANIINSSDGGFVIVGPGEIDRNYKVSDGWVKKFKAF